KVSRIPSGAGEGIMSAEGQAKPYYVKTVIPGGKSDGDILMQVRVLALDWVRRTIGGNIDYTRIPNDMGKFIQKGFNRDMYYNQALKALDEGRVTDPLKPDDEYLIKTGSSKANLIGNALQKLERDTVNNQPEEFALYDDDDEEEAHYADEEMFEIPTELENFDWDTFKELEEEPEEVSLEEEPEEASWLGSEELESEYPDELEEPEEYELFTESGDLDELDEPSEITNEVGSGLGGDDVFEFSLDDVDEEEPDEYSLEELEEPVSVNGESLEEPVSVNSEELGDNDFSDEEAEELNVSLDDLVPDNTDEDVVDEGKIAKMLDLLKEKSDVASEENAEMLEYQ